MIGRRSWEVALLCVLAAAPILWSAIALWGEWHPVGDVAFVGVRASDVISADPPLVGMPTTLSRAIGEQAYHPGPLAFWLLALPVELSGGHRLAPMVGIAAINIACAVGIVLLAARAAGRTGAVMAAAATVVLLASLRGELLVDPWNPHAAVLPLALCLVALAADLGGVRWALPVAALAGSLSAQAHLASATAFAGAVAGWIAVAIIGRRWRMHRHGLIAGAAVLALCWTPVVIGELTGSPGNLRTLAQGTGEEDTLGRSARSALAANALAPPAVWMSSRSGADDVLDRPGAGQGLLALAVGAGAAAAALHAWRRDRRFVAGLAASALGALAVGALAATRIPAANALAVHPFLWTWPVGVAVWAALVGALAARWRAVAAVALLAAVVAVVALPGRIVGDRRAMDAIRPLASQLQERLPQGTYRVDWGEGGLDAGRVMAGLLYALDGDTGGVDLRLAPRYAPSVTDDRTAPRSQVDGTLVVETGALQPPPAPVAGASVAAEYRPDQYDVLRLRRTERSVIDAVHDAGGVRLATGTRLSGRDAEAFVHNGDLVLYARLGLLEQPRLSTAQIDELAARQNAPVVFVRVFRLPED